MAVSGHSVTQSMQPVQLLADVLRNLRRDVAEIAQRRRAGRDQRAGDRQVGRQLLLAVAFFVAADDPLVEVDARRGSAA